WLSIRYVLKTDKYTLHIIFFFSSRRRHTRLVSDWSSDVCSSDLIRAIVDNPQKGQPGGRGRPARPTVWEKTSPGNPFVKDEAQRSEERRVGKECRYRRGP